MKTNIGFKKTLSVLSLLALVIAVSYYFIYQDIRSKNERISKLQYDLSTQSTKQDYLISTEKAIQSLEVDLDKAQSSIVSKEAEIEFIEKIETLARSNGLAIEIESLVLKNQDLPSPDLTVLNVKAKTRGTWAGTYLFLAQLESLPYKLKIGRSSMIRVGAGSQGSGATWDSNVEIGVLKYK